MLLLVTSNTQSLIMLLNTSTERFETILLIRWILFVLCFTRVGEDTRVDYFRMTGGAAVCLGTRDAGVSTWDDRTLLRIHV